MAAGSRWPRWLYDSGEEPDYRFSFANERTFLAWIRTALALLAGGVALDAIRLTIPSRLQTALASMLVVLGLVCAVVSWVRWARAERSMRHDEALPGSVLGLLLTAAVVIGAAAILLAWGVDP